MSVCIVNDSSPVIFPQLELYFMMWNNIIWLSFYFPWIHRDKSFHCEVCNVCLDKCLEGKHECRPDSGHDECCICLEVRKLIHAPCYALVGFQFLFHSPLWRNRFLYSTAQKKPNRERVCEWVQNGYRMGTRTWMEWVLNGYRMDT